MVVTASIAGMGKRTVAALHIACATWVGVALPEASAVLNSSHLHENGQAQSDSQYEGLESSPGCRAAQARRRLCKGHDALRPCGDQAIRGQYTWGATYMKAPLVVGITSATICPRMSVVRGSWWVGSCTGSGYAGVPGECRRMHDTRVPNACTPPKCLAPSVMRLTVFVSHVLCELYPV